MNISMMGYMLGINSVRSSFRFREGTFENKLQKAHSGENFLTE